MSESDDIDRFLREDIGTGDITTSMFVPDIAGQAVIRCEQDAVVAGLEEASEIFSRMGVRSESLIGDGDRVKADTEVMRVSGPLRSILTCERTALNMMMRMSGIATMVSDATAICRRKSQTVKVAGTRKTTPGFRRYEKKAIVLGGGDPHRYGLYDLILIKDNHIKAVGGVMNAMEIAMDAPYNMKVEIEVENETDAAIAARCGADIIMMDNRSPEEAERIYNVVKSIDPGIMVEASGRITLDNISDYADRADRISMGAVTHSVKAVHFSLDIL